MKRMYNGRPNGFAHFAIHLNFTPLSNRTSVRASAMRRLCTSWIVCLLVLGSGAKSTTSASGGSTSEKDVGCAAQWAQDDADIKVFVKYSVHNEHISNRNVRLVVADITETEVRLQALETPDADGKTTLRPERYWFVAKLHGKIDPKASSHKKGPFGVLFKLRKQLPKGLGFIDPMWPRLLANGAAAENIERWADMAKVMKLQKADARARANWWETYPYHCEACRILVHVAVFGHSALKIHGAKAAKAMEKGGDKLSFEHGAAALLDAMGDGLNGEALEELGAATLPSFLNATQSLVANKGFVSALVGVLNALLERHEHPHAWPYTKNIFAQKPKAQQLKWPIIMQQIDSAFMLEQTMAACGYGSATRGTVTAEVAEKLKDQSFGGANVCRNPTLAEAKTKCSACKVVMEDLHSLLGHSAESDELRNRDIRKKGAVGITETAHKISEALNRLCEHMRVRHPFHRHMFDQCEELVDEWDYTLARVARDSKVTERLEKLEAVCVEANMCETLKPAPWGARAEAAMLQAATIAKSFNEAKVAKGDETLTEEMMADRFQENMKRESKRQAKDSKKEAKNEKNEKEAARVAKVKADHEARKAAEKKAAQEKAADDKAAEKKAKKPLSKEELAARAARKKKHEEMLKAPGKAPSELREDRKAKRRELIRAAQAARCKICRALVGDIWGKLAPQHSREEADFIDEATADDVCASAPKYATAQGVTAPAAKLACKTTVDEHGESIGQAMYNNRFQNVNVAVEQACYWLLKCQEGRDEL